MVWNADTAGYLLRPWLITPLTDGSSQADPNPCKPGTHRVAELLGALLKGWLLTVDQGKLFWRYFVLLVALVGLSCHLWNALFTPFSLMCRCNPLVCYWRIASGISAITDCGTLSILTSEAVGKVCACIAHAPVHSWGLQLRAQGGKTIVEYVLGTILQNAPVSACFYHFPPFWQLPEST